MRSAYVLGAQAPGWAELCARAAPSAVARALRASGMTADEVALFQREIVEDGALPGALGWYRALPLEVGRSVPKVRVPTTHVWSDGDTALSRRRAELTQEYVDAPYELRVLEGVTHWAPTQAPALVADAVLARVDAVARGNPVR